MNSPAAVTPSPAFRLSEARHAALLNACGYIAPSWPLDRMIAVNPWWHMRHWRPEKVASRLSVLAGIQGQLPLSAFRRLWQQGVFSEPDIRTAAAQLGATNLCDTLCAALDGAELPAETLPQWRNISQLLDELRDPQRMPWQDALQQQISRFCLAALQGNHPLAVPENQCLYHHWHQSIAADSGLEWLLAAPGLRQTFRTLPDDLYALLEVALDELRIIPERVTDYAHALLLDVNGWASHLAWQAWQANLEQRQLPPRLLQLLAIRMAWELALWRSQGASKLLAAWQAQQHQLAILETRHAEAQHPLRVLARACELAFQRDLATRLQNAALPGRQTPRLQAVFCIDVRSEPMRRALELQDTAIQTAGFAGFFGLPMAYQAVGSSRLRAQLPGLLAPALRVSESGEQAQALAQRRQRRWNLQAGWQRWSQSATGMFGQVETFGLASLAGLLRASLAGPQSRRPDETYSDWALFDGERSLTHEERLTLASRILEALDLPCFAEEVLLVGHASQSSNNPQACSLECGACGGHSGEVNAAVLADLLNHPGIRADLLRLGWQIPTATRFIAAVHNTTLDSLEVHGTLSTQAQNWLQQAEQQARRWRIGTLEGGLDNRSDQQLLRHLQQRASDWSQVRPEWGLAGNAALIVAPRTLTRGMDLQGRCFLHDYRAEHDPSFQRLEQIMTAPMLVAHWINMQYNTSVWDNRRYGSGNKVLHNVALGQLGLFEGQGGDLRSGLSMQSLHDGSDWRHVPLKLSVYIQAPVTALQQICERHQVLSELVGGEWLYLFSLDKQGVATPVLLRQQTG